MREITIHHVPGVPETVRVFPENDEHNHYQLAIGKPGQETQGTVRIRFQKGNPAEQVNGITNEALLAIIIDRLQNFQKGVVASCHENAVALTHLETAMLWLQKRTLDRIGRGVHGEQKV